MSEILPSGDRAVRRAENCPVCGHRGRPSREGRCTRCRALVTRPPGEIDDGQLPPWAALLVRGVTDAWIARGLAKILPGRILPVTMSYATAALALLMVHSTLTTLLHNLSLVAGGGAGLADWLYTLLVLPVFVPCTAFLALVMLNNAKEMMMMGLARKSAAHQLGSWTPIEDARFWAMRLRGRRAFATHVTFRTDRLPPSARIGLEVMLRDAQGKVLPAALPRYRAPDGEFRARELSAPIGKQDDFLFTIGALLPVSAIRMRAEPGETVRVRAELKLTYEGRVQATQELTASFVARADDFPAPPKPRDGEQVEAASEEEVDFVGEVDATAGGCPVCGEGFEGETLGCDQCGVPHHPECWAFAGRCSTYGCDGDPTVARTINSSGTKAAAGGP